MFIARRPFRNVGTMVAAGTILVPADIHRFKYQLRFGNIIEIQDDKLPEWVAFFKARYDVDITEQLAKKEEPVEAKPKAAPKKVEKPAKEPDTNEVVTDEKPVAAKAQPVKPSAKAKDQE